MALATRTRRNSTGSSGLKTFLTPGWIITLVLVIAFSYFAIWVLSPWQLGKDDVLVDRNEHVARAFEEDPTAYSNIFDDQGRIKDGQEWMRITASGEFLTDKEVLLRMRPLEGSGPVYQSLTPFRLDSGETILVNRGWDPTRAGDAPTVPAPPEGELTITGHARYNEVKPPTAPMFEHGYEQVYGINTEEISSIIDVPLGQDYLQLSEGSAGTVNALPLPSLDRGNHLSYGFQWIAFGIMAPLGLGYFAWSEIKERKRARQEEEEMEQAANNQVVAAGAPPEHPEEPSMPTPEPVVEEEPQDHVEVSAETAHARKMRSRYGDSHKNYFEKRRGGTFN